jgi:arylsulfatase A-like enzyme
MFMRFLAVAILVGLGLGTMPTAESAERPNVLFFAVDDLRPEFGAYAADYVKSPNMDRIAKAGVTFERAYCQQAVCSPSRSSVMTGTRPDTTKVWDLETHFRKALPDVVTLGQHFKNNGYFVQGMGKIYHGGFDDAPTWSVPWQGASGPTYALPENVALTQEKRAAQPGKQKGASKKKAGAAQNARRRQARGPRGPAFESADVPDDTYRDGKIATLAVETLKELSQKQEPFFLAVGFSKPHLPFIAPKKYWDLYDPAKIELAPNEFRPHDAPEYAIQPGGELRSYHGIPSGSIPDDMARNLKHGYYAAISYMDAQVGRVLDELERLGLAKNTIVVLWGDHGWKLGEHDAWCKHSNCENDTNATLLLAAPGMQHAGAQSKALVEFVDIYPTLADLAGLPLPEHLEGTSFKPVLETPDRPWKSAAFSQYPRVTPEGKLMGYAMRTARYRLVVWVRNDGSKEVEAIELYDHESDPQENQNLAQRPEHKELVEQLMAQWRGGWQQARP